MPEQNANLEELKKELKQSLENVGGKLEKIEEQEVAFGLKALIVTITWPEEKGTEKVEKACKIKQVSSVDIIDYRRAFG